MGWGGYAVCVMLDSHGHGRVVDLNEISVLDSDVCAHQHVWECVVVAIKRKMGSY